MVHCQYPRREKIISGLLAWPSIRRRKWDRSSKCLAAIFYFLSSGQKVAGKSKEQRLIANMSTLSQEGPETAAKWYI